MAFEEDKKYDALLNKVKQACRVAYLVLRVIFYLACLTILIFLTASIYTLILPGTTELFTDFNHSVIIQILLFGSMSVILVRLAMLIFKDISLGLSPFTREQSRRIRLISYIMFAQVFLELVFSAAIPAFFTDQLAISYHTSAASEPTLFVNLQILVFAVVFFCLSKAFEYGALLQQDKDEFI